MKVVIGIPTMGRRAPLFRLLRSIVRSCDGHALQPTLLIVQNDPVFTLADDAELRDVVGTLPLELRHEPRAGLCFVRNRLFEEADALGHDWFFGVDDDEWVSEAWYGILVAQAQERGPSSILFGPCALVYDDTLSRYRTPYYAKPRQTGKRPPFCATHNFAMHRSFFSTQHAGHRFDPAFNFGGGEDEELFARIKLHGDAEMVWIAEAVVSEERIAERGTLGYLLVRSRRVALSRFRIKERHDHIFRTNKASSNAAIFFKSTRKCLVGSLRALIQFASVPATGIAGQRRCGDALAVVWNGLAGFDFLLDRRPVHYGQGHIDNVETRANE